MKCPECLTENIEGEAACRECGFKFAADSEEEAKAYFEAYRRVLTEAYTEAKTPWEQSGKSGRYEDWVRLRIPVSECVESSGTFLDIGCANGFLLECLMAWTRAKGLEIVPYGLDYSEEILAMARERLPQYRDNLFLGNAWDWKPPRQFDFVRTETVYTPENLRMDYLKRLLAEFVAPGGRLLVAHYRSRREDLNRGWEEERLRDKGFTVEGVRSGFSAEGLELCRVAVVRKPYKSTANKRSKKW